MSRHRYSLSNHPEARQRALWLIRDYANIKAKVDELDGFRGGSSDGAPRSTVPHSSTEDMAVKRAELSWQMDVVDEALETLPEEYRLGVWRHIVDRERYPDTAALATWKRNKQKFVYKVAEYAGFI